MKKLIAKRPVLYLGRMYDAGDTLPANDQKMVTAWLNAKSAAWDGQEAGERHQEAQEDAGQADGSQDSRGQSGGQEAQVNGQEFADTHTIDGREMDAVVDDDALLERDAARGGVHSDGIYRVRRLLYVAKADYGGRPPSGKRLNLDGREYRVVQADDAAGMLTIEIEANRT